MKKMILIGAACLLAIAGMAVAVISSLGKNSIDLSIATDKTDSLMPVPDAAVIYSSLGLDEHKWAKLRVRINTFSNFDYNPSSYLVLPPKLFLISNPDNRDSAIERFKKSFAQHLFEVRQQATGLPKSSIYGPMIRDLNRLAKSAAKTKIALYFTDCRENSKLFSSYNKNDLKLLKENPQKVQALFEKMEKPGNLTGLKVFLICQPTTDEENYCFGLMSQLFKKILENAGAKIYIGADIHGYEN